MTNQPHYYETDLKWTGGRKGILSSPSLNEEIEVATPPEFMGGVKGIWSPEHLFTAAINTCLMTTFLAIAESSKLHFQHFSSRAKGKLDIVDGKYLMTDVELYPEVIVEDESQVARAERILEKSEKLCLISNSVRSGIRMFPKITLLKKEADQLSR